MQRELLQKMRLEALRTLAMEKGVPGAPALGRAELIEKLAVAPGPPELEDDDHDGSDGFDIPSSTVHPHGEQLEPLDMAHRYVAEGQLDRARELLERLATADPGDTSVSVALAELRRRTSSGPLRPTVSSEPFGMLDYEELPETYGVDECEVLYRDPHTVFVYWEVTEGGIASARAQLGPSGTGAHLVLRLFITHGQEHGSVRDLKDYDAGWNHGRRYLTVSGTGAQVRLAVGLLCKEGYFAPITHSQLVRLPTGAPSREMCTEWMEVVPAHGRGLRPEPLVVVRRDPQHQERGPGGQGNQAGGGAGGQEPLGSSRAGGGGGQEPLGSSRTPSSHEGAVRW